MTIHPTQPRSRQAGLQSLAGGLTQQNSAIAPPVGSTGNRTAGSALVQPGATGGVPPEIPGDRNIPGTQLTPQPGGEDIQAPLPGQAPSGLQQGTLPPGVDPAQVGQPAGGAPVTASPGGEAFTPTPQANAVATAKNVPITSETVPPPSGIPQQLFDPEVDQKLRDEFLAGGGDPAQFNPNQSPLQQQLNEQLSQNLANPSGFTSDVAKNTFQQLSDELEQGFAQRRAGVDTDAARRGVFFSTAPLAGKSRLASDQARQQRGLASDILLEQGRTLGADRARAAGQAQQQTGRGFQEQLQQFLAQQGAGQQAFGQQSDRLRNLLGQRQQSTQSQLAANQQQIQQDQFRDQLGIQAGQLGLQGQANQNQLMSNIAALFGGQQGGQIDPAIFRLLGQGG